jgi:hypothetical protein
MTATSFLEMMHLQIKRPVMCLVAVLVLASCQATSDAEPGAAPQATSSQIEVADNRLPPRGLALGLYERQNGESGTSPKMQPASRVSVGRGFDDEGNLTTSLTWNSIGAQGRPFCQEVRYLEPDGQIWCVDGTMPTFALGAGLSDGTIFVVVDGDQSNARRKTNARLGTYVLIRANARYHLPLINDRGTQVFRDEELSIPATEIPAFTPMMQLDEQTSPDQPDIVLARPLRAHIAWQLPDGLEETGRIDMESFVRGKWVDQTASTPLATFRAAIEQVDGFTILNAIEVVDRATEQRRQLLFSGARSKRPPGNAIEVSSASGPGEFHILTFEFRTDDGGSGGGSGGDSDGDAGGEGTEVQVGTFLLNPETNLYADYPVP